MLVKALERINYTRIDQTAERDTSNYQQFVRKRLRDKKQSMDKESEVKV